MPLNLADSDDSRQQDGDVTAETLPSATDSSGLTPAVRQQLDVQFQSTGGDADALVRDLRARIQELDDRTVAEDDPQHTQLQAQRALYVAQVSYVEDYLAVHGVDSSRATRSDRDDTSMARTTSEPARTATAASRGRGRARVYDTTR
jgi:hypothetical protein